MKKIDADKRLINTLGYYGYKYLGNFEYEFHFDRTEYGTSLTIIMLDGCEDNDREFAYRVELYYSLDSGQVNFEVSSDGYSFGMDELHFFTLLESDRRLIMAIYNSIEED